MQECKTLDELIAALQELKQRGTPGTTEIGYVDNGDFAENGGWTYPTPRLGYDGAVVL